MDSATPTPDLPREPLGEAPSALTNPAPTSESIPSDAPVPATMSSSAPTPAPAQPPSKPIHALVLDTGPLIKNEIALSTLIAQAEELYTIPSVISEIRDEATRSRFQTTLVPFLKFRSPRPESIQFITGFARRTGDLEVLSKPDIHLLALTYELECERNGSDWRLRREPAQKGLNGKPPGQETNESPQPSGDDQIATELSPEISAETATPTEEQKDVPETAAEESSEAPKLDVAPENVAEQLDQLNIASSGEPGQGVPLTEVAEDDAEEDEEDDGEGEWITPSNIKKHKDRENTGAKPEPIQRVLQAALLTSDIAMRNVALRINLNLLDSSCQRITYLRTWVLRCHGCFKICKNLSRQFCPNCGQATLTRVSCSTDAAGNFTVHLKKNFQWNNRGNVYSIPKPTHGSASGKNANVRGGGKNGWGKELLLAEDQKEYTKKVEENNRARYRDLMDEDYLPSLLTGDRKGGAGKIRVGAGRNVNGRKR